MGKSLASLALVFELALAAGWHSPTFSQNKYRREIKGRALVKFDWNCASPSAYRKVQLERIVRGSMKLARVSADAGGDRAFAFDLNGDQKPEHFVPLACGATGNCDWGVFTLNPTRYLGTINGQYIFVHRHARRWPTILTYGHLSAAEGSVGTYRFSKKRYVSTGDEYPIGPEDRTLEIQNVSGHRMPGFLERARAGCKNLGW